MPEVSVIIPNYNHAPYLELRIQSVLDQTYQNFEVIILDDASTDNSMEIIRQYEDHAKVKEVVLNEHNSGSPFKQWKRGLELAQGRWVWIAESDDYADPLFLETLLAAVENQSQVGLIYCDSKIVIDDKTTQETFANIKNRKFNTRRWSEGYLNDGVPEIENYLLPGGTINNTRAVLFRKDVLMAVDPFDISLKHIGDKYAFIKVLSCSHVQYVKESLNYFRDPFVSKHTKKYISFFYEQFLVFDWVYKNLAIKDKKNFFEGFFSNTRNSLFKEWNADKIKIYSHLFQVNPNLLMRSVAHNLTLSLSSLFNRKINHINSSHGR